MPPRETIYRLGNLLAEVFTNLRNLASDEGVGVGWVVSVPRPDPVFELLLDIVELDTEVVADIDYHLELLVKAKNMPAFTSVLEFAVHKSNCNCM